jgi:hypothetical protein
MNRAAGSAILAMLLGSCVPLPDSPTRTASPATACAATAQFSFVCGADKPEDLAHIPGTPWMIASGFAKGAGLKLVDTRHRTARLWFTGRPDQIASDPGLGDCNQPPDVALFTARGLSLRVVAPGKARLHVVNHGGRESIEVFSVDFSDSKQMPTLTWQGCLLMPPDHTANSVTTYSDGTVLATVLTRPGTSITDFVLGRLTGGVYQRGPHDTAFHLLPGTQLPGNNGLAAARDDSGFYVIAFGLRQVLAFDRGDSSAPLWRLTVPDFMPDNIHWDGDRLIMAGMMRDEPACGGIRRIINGVADGMTCHRGYAVAQVDPVSQRLTMLAYGPPDPQFNGVSAAVLIGQRLWLGSYQADRIAVRDLTYALP